MQNDFILGMEVGAVTVNACCEIAWFPGGGCSGITETRGILSAGCLYCDAARLLGRLLLSSSLRQFYCPEDRKSMCTW